MNIETKPGVKRRADDVKNTNMVKEYRCPVCKRLLMKGKITIIEIRCPKCKKITVVKDM